MADAQSQPDALALADSVKFAIQHRDEEIERLKAECINELMGQKKSLDAYYEKRIATLSAENSVLQAFCFSLGSEAGIPYDEVKELLDPASTRQMRLCPHCHVMTSGECACV